MFDRFQLSMLLGEVCVRRTVHINEGGVCRYSAGRGARCRPRRLRRRHTTHRRRILHEEVSLHFELLLPAEATAVSGIVPKKATNQEIKIVI